MRSSWDNRYRERSAPVDPAAFVTVELAPLLGSPGRVLDLAGGAGRHSVWLAERGWEATMLDTSEVAISLAAARAREAGVDLTLVHSDLTAGTLPSGPWDLVLIVHYLQRDLFARAIELLADDGLIAFSVATVRNLERRERPPRPYLLEEGEAPSFVDGLQILHYAEDWSVEDRHEARVVARKRSRSVDQAESSVLDCQLPARRSRPRVSGTEYGLLTTDY